MINIVIYGICQEMHMNGQQNTLPTFTTVATCTLVLIVEGFTAQLVAKPSITRLTAATLARVAAALVVHVPYFM